MAVERFTDSSTARSLFGSPFVDHYARSRLVEDEACRRFVSADERARYQHQV
jgi:glutamine synthetase